MSALLAVVLTVASSTGVHFRLMDDGSPFRPLERTSLLYGPVEFRVRAPEATEASGLRIATDSVTPGGDTSILCESGGPDASCRVELPYIAGGKLQIEYDLVTPGRERRRISRSVTTLHTYPGLDVKPGERSVVEHTRALGTPPDHVTRAIRFESTTDSGPERPVRYVTDVAPDELDVKVRGVRGTTIVSLSPPDPTAPKMIPILFDVAPYLKQKKRGGGVEWEDSYARRVADLRQGLERAATSGVDVEYLVVSYGADSRLLGPFRLHPGRIDESARSANDKTLDALNYLLLLPPDAGSPPDDFGSIVHTLNDLYLRGRPGVVQLVWITDGWSAGGTPRFLPDLWPERLAQVNPEWSADEQTQTLTALDAGLGLQDAELTRFLAALPPDEPDRASRILEFLRTLDRDATHTLDPHRVETSPMLSCMFVPSDRSLRGDRFNEFREFVEQSWGGDLVRFLRLRKSNPEQLEEELNERRQGPGSESLAGLLRATAEQMAHSGRIELEVPNPKQNGARREIKIKVRRNGVRARLMPTYASSRPRDERLAGFLASPFKTLRLLAAYETRYHPFDDRLRGASRQRWQVESDPQVRAVLFESWIAVQLQRLQTGEDRRGAHDALVEVGRAAARLPSPALARDAAAAAEWFGSRLTD